MKTRLTRILPLFLILMAGTWCRLSAQTSIDATISSSLAVDGSTTPPTWTYSWWGLFGYRYVVQVSPDLQSWIELSGINPAGQDADISITYDVQGADKYFFRAIQYDPATTSGFIDTDSDGLPDWWERTWFGDLSATASGNPDSDSRTNVQEFHLGTNPTATDPDSDGDGMVDAWETAFGLNPNANDATLDPDGDGQTNLQEYNANTNPFDHDNGRAFFLDFPATWSGVFAYTYDNANRIETVNYGGSDRSSLTFDAAANLQTAANGSVPIVAWRTFYGLTANGTGNGADTACPAGDGLPNFAKYAMGLDPTVYVPTANPIVRLTAVGGYKFLTLTYQRPNPAPTGVVYRVEVSGDNGTTWQSGPAEVEEVSIRSDSSLTLRTLRDVTAVGSPAFGRRIRLVIQRTL
jgi:hypothetical protein